MNLNGKVAIVTGVSSGIGRATAEALLAHGAAVAGWGRHAPEGLTHDRFQFFECDVRDEHAKPAAERRLRYDDEEAEETDLEE